MNWIEALILGILQGFTEFLPVSSSGHIELGKHFLDIRATESLSFTIVVHGATVLSTIIVFRKDLVYLFGEVIKFRLNEGTRFIIKIFISMIPVLILGLFFRQDIEGFFSGDIYFVGAMLLVTSLFLLIAYFRRNRDKKITYFDSFIIGVSQALAVLPGISRSGATIATGLILQNNKEEVTRFSFLMVLLPIIGAMLMDILTGENIHNEIIGIIPLLAGFLSAFVIGLLACKWMIKLVKKGKLIYFAAYCLVIGMIAILFG